MAPLPVDLRNQLSRAIQDARREAEAGARKALQSLAVDLAKAHDSMDKPARELRGRLRAHGKQLGDTRDLKDAQVIDRLAHEVAYEHWHRMLFARFLAENRLLIEPRSGVAISMEECEELAREQGVDPWALGASYAQAMLPKIFRADDPVLEVQLPPETRLSLERHLESLPVAVFTADDALGWTYQFWQTEREAAVRRAGVQIGAEELPAVTQFFTEHYMVLFLFHNTIGAWRSGKVLAANPELARSARNEDELRSAIRLSAHGGYDFVYLRFVRERVEGDEPEAPSGPWRPAAGTFEGWPKHAAELKVLDPCCGSGHFLVEALSLLVRLRMEEEGLSTPDAIVAVLADNLFGLEIDLRCTQIAAFNLALAAWRLAGSRIALPLIGIACSGLAVSVVRQEWLDFAGADARVLDAMERLYDLFAQASVLGSLIDPTSLTRQPGAPELYTGTFTEVRPMLAEFVAANPDSEQFERAIAAQGMAAAAQLLASRYTLVITNVPYLGREGHAESLAKFGQDFASDAAADLATLMLNRCIQLTAPCATAALVLPQNWWVGKSYSRFRARVLTTTTWRFAAVLGEEAWRTYGNRGPNTVLLIADHLEPGLSHTFSALDVSTKPNMPVVDLETKSCALAGMPLPPEHGALSAIRQVAQLALIKGRESRITVAQVASAAPLSLAVVSGEGSSTGDSDRYVHFHWEVPQDERWIRYCEPGFATSNDCDSSKVMYWERGNGELAKSPQARIQNTHLWNRQGILVGRVRGITATLSSGGCFSKGAVLVYPRDSGNWTATYAFLKSHEYESLVRGIDPRVSAATSVITDVPFDLRRWQEIGEGLYPGGIPEPESEDPTQQTFHGRPEASTNPLHVSVARLVGYRWPAELDLGMRISERARVLARSCDALLSFADRDGILCIPSVRGEKPMADRLLAVLLTCGLKADRDVDEWLRNDFFEEHCKLFHHRPFIWHIWDGRPDGFHALVNYHRLAGPNGEGRRTLQALTFSYLGDWIDRQKADQREGKEGADARLAAAQDLQAQLEKILTGDPPCDIFVRWKPLHQQAIGWDPDINDGVRLNIRPFMSVELHKGGRTGAGILRWKPNINWRKDRGTEPEDLRPANDFPWLWDCPGEGSIDERTDFKGGADCDGCRWNDLHYSNAVKKSARDNPRAGGEK